MDSGFRRNDVKKNQINFFTPSPIKGEGVFLTFYAIINVSSCGFCVSG